MTFFAVEGGVVMSTKLLKHFISRTFTFLLLALLIPHVSAPYNAVGTITLSYRHILFIIQNSLLLRTLFSAPLALYLSFILCTPSLFTWMLSTLIRTYPQSSIVQQTFQLR